MSTYTPKTPVQRMPVAGFILSLVLASGPLQSVVGATSPDSIPYATEQVILEGDSPAVIAEKAAKVLPRPNQSVWMRLKWTFFLHYGPNAFNHVEWGSGREEPSDFNPRPSMPTSGSRRCRRPAA